VTTVQARGVNSLVTMNIRPQYAPLPVDTSAILREKTLLGEAYVELSAGNGAGRKFADGGTIPTSHIANTQQLDQVLGSFDAQTQKNLQTLLNGTGQALAGRGQDLNDTLGNLDPAVTELSAVVGVLNQQQGNLRQVINSGATVLSTLGDRRSDLQSLITAGDQVLSATAQRNTALTATVNALPPFLTELRTTLGSLNTTLGIAAPSLRALRPVAPLLTPALRELTAVSGPALHLLHVAPPVLTAAQRALPVVASFTNAFRPTVNALLPAAEQIVPVINFIAQHRGELVTAMANLGADLEATAPANTVAGTASYLRAISGLSSESVFGQSIREPTNRNNTYYSPGEQVNLGTGGLLSANCGNTQNVAQVPLLAANVPCRLQAAYPWGKGIGTSYYPRVKAAAP
jgi:phospholipid/cholesterol/gamma-HCH transport system substrate-binding protein